MSSRWLVAIGLAAGLLVGAIAWAGLVLLGPLPQPSPTLPPSLALPTLRPSPSPSVVPASPSGLTPSPSASASAFASPGATPSASAAALFGVGEPAPPLQLPKLGGGAVDLAAFRGKPVWVYFMATWCPSCRDELPLIDGFSARYAKDGLVTLAVDVREDAATVGALASSLKLTTPIALDADGRAQAAWRAAALPVHFWVDANGIVRDGVLGGIGPDLMASGLGSILPGVTVTP